jgi:hypothetical protein
MLCSFYCVKSGVITRKSTMSQVREKINADFGILRFFDLGFTTFKNNQILL